MKHLIGLSSVALPVRLIGKLYTNGWIWHHGQEFAPDSCLAMPRCCGELNCAYTSREVEGRWSRACLVEMATMYEGVEHTRTWCDKVGSISKQETGKHS